MDDMFSSLWIQWCNFTLDFPATGPLSDNVNFRGDWVKRHFNNSSACHASTFLGNKLTLLALNYLVLIFFPFRSVFEISTRTATSLLLRDSLSLYGKLPWGSSTKGALLSTALCLCRRMLLARNSETSEFVFVALSTGSTTKSGLRLVIRKQPTLLQK